MKLEVPEVLRREHRELHVQLQAASILHGSVGKAASALLEIMGRHLKREEEVAFPVLGLLPHLVEGRVGEEMVAALAVTDRLRAELKDLRREHVAMLDAVEALAEAARREGRAEYGRLAHDLLEHARLEEAVLYPAALIVGEYVRLRLEALARP